MIVNAKEVPEAGVKGGARMIPESGRPKVGPAPPASGSNKTVYGSKRSVEDGIRNVINTGA